MSRILVVSPHPDDEAVGCGGTLAWHHASGDRIEAIFLTSGEAGGHGRSPAETGPMREAEAERAAAVLGIASLQFWRLADGALTVDEALVARMATALAVSCPDLVYVPHPGEQHRDHQAAAAVVIAAAGSSEPTTLYGCEVWTPLSQFDRVVDISPYIERKLAAIRAHQSQCAVLPFDHAMLGLARYRGEMHSWPGGPYAEVFQELRPAGDR